MPTYRVTNTIVSGNIDGGEPVEVQWYIGADLASAMAAMANSAAAYRDVPDDRMPESMRSFVLGVSLHIDADCPWRDQPGPGRPFWAQHECSGREVDTEVGILCAAHHKSMRDADEIALPVKSASASTSSDETPAQWAERSGLGVSWEYDDHGTNHVKEFPDAYDEEPDECLVATLANGRGDVFASLGCIDDPTADYRAEVEANLIAEAYAEAHPKN